MRDWTNESHFFYLFYHVSFTGNSQLGATIVDALDTLYIMGLHEEFKDGQEWIEQNLDFGVVCTVPTFILHTWVSYKTISEKWQHAQGFFRSDNLYTVSQSNWSASVADGQNKPRCGTHFRCLSMSVANCIILTITLIACPLQREP